MYKTTKNNQYDRTNILIVYDNPKNWSRNLSYVTYVINISISDSTKTSPFCLSYGTETTSILDLCLPEVPDNVPRTIPNDITYRRWG